MSDSVKKYYEMKLEGQYKEHPKAKYIWVLDFGTGGVYLYDISPLCNDLNKWNPDSESCEAFLIGAGHYLKNCEWMVTDSDNVNKK
jgi:hypothetical protein